MVATKFTTKKLKLLRSLFPLGIVISAISGIIFLQSHEIQKTEHQLEQTEYMAQESKEKKSLIFFENLPSLGLQNLMADWLYLQFIQYFGDNPAREKTDYKLCPIYFKNIVTRDSRFTNAVINLDVCTSIFAGYPLQSIQYLTDSVEKIQPKMEGVTIRPYYIWRALGMAQLLFSGEPLAAAESYKKAIEWAKEYQDEDSQRFIANLQKSVNYLAKNPDSTMAQIGAWVNVLNTNPDEKTFKRVVQEIKSLGGTVEISSDGQLKVTLPKNAD